jgi:hypothetical protein
LVKEADSQAPGVDWRLKERLRLEAKRLIT